jgi:hypothetical protein
MLGHSKRNKWCCFCKHWFDPSCSALKPKMAPNMYDVDNTKRLKCNNKNVITPALFVCKDFECKL